MSEPPDPSAAGSVDALVERLRQLKIWAGDPSYETIKDRVNTAWTAAGHPAAELTTRSTVASSFTPGRRRLTTDLVLAIVEALHPDTGYVTLWHQALRVVGGETEAVAQVRVRDTLPPDLAEFTGRLGEIDRLTGDAVVVSVIEGMAGVGKTQLAVHIAHRLLREKAYDRVLFVNLRGFHPDPAQPPAEPGAVLDGFLRLLGTPGHRIPHDPAARSRLYRDRLAGTRALIVLDNAATAEQVRPLLPGGPGCLALVTSRRNLADLDPGIRLAVDVFGPDEAAAFLSRSLPADTDPHALARIARRCGYLPLALSLVAGHIRNTPGWTLADHADRLDQRHATHRLDTGVELALDLSYQHVPAERQRLFRLAALHPGQDFDAYAAAALTGAGLATTEAGLDELRRDHLLQESTAGRYGFHDLVRAHAAGHAHDEDPPSERRAALTRLFDHYLATSAAAMTTLHPADTDYRPPAPASATPTPDLTEPDAALAWLETERTTLLAVAHGSPAHTVRLARTLSRHLRNGHYADALALHGHAHDAARRSGDRAEQAYALIDIGFAHLRLGRAGPADEHFRRALDLSQEIGDPAGQAHAHYHLGLSAGRVDRIPAAVDHAQRAAVLYRQAGDAGGESGTLSYLGSAMQELRRFPEGLAYARQALALARRIGDRNREKHALTVLGDIEVTIGRHESASEHLHLARHLCRQLGERTGEAGILESLGTLYLSQGRPDRATECYEQSLAMFRELGNQSGQGVVLESLGKAAQATGRPADAIRHYTDALALAVATGRLTGQAESHVGLGRAHRALGDLGTAREHDEQALAIYASLGMPEADEVRARLAAAG